VIAVTPIAAPGGSTSRIRVLLVDDQPIIGEAVRRMLAPESDIEFVYCADPTRAIAVAADCQPTVILQDLVMPQVDGLTMLRSYRANADMRDIPVIVLSTKEEPKVKAEAFTLGASDYLVKLPDPIELIARIRMHSRGYIALVERNAAYAALQQSEQRIAEELAEAAQYVISLLPTRMAGEITTDWDFIPSVELGGDAFGHHWLDDGRFVIYLLDVCGHGVKAALLSISAMNALRNRSLQGIDYGSPAQVLAALNDAFPMERHSGLYFTMFYAVYDQHARHLTYASGGHPPAILMAGATRETAAPIQLGTRGMIIGGMPGMQFRESRVDLPPFSRLYVFSDGIYEITKPDGTMMRLQEFVEIVSGALRGGRSVIGDTIRAVRAVQGSDGFADDVSMMEVAFCMDKIEMQIGSRVSELEKVAAAIDRIADEWDLPSKVAMQVNLAVEELFTNIVFHGHADDPAEHSIGVVFSRTDRTLSVVIADDAPPFDLLVQAKAPDTELALADRAVGGLGIHFVKSIMDRVEYERRDGKNIVTLTKSY
jgi:sigma-B regulation protein RsbU (phosphoserine phosphatase)